MRASGAPESGGRPPVAVIGREAERAAIGRWLASARPAALVVAGEPGIGKSTLWRDALDHRAGSDLVLAWRATAAEQEMAFAVVTALFDGEPGRAAMASLAEPRRLALAAAFGRVVTDQAAPAPHLVGLAIADLLREMATGQPVLLAVDDLQWVDEPSAAVLAVAARRLGDAPVGLLATARTDPDGGAHERVDIAFAQHATLSVGPLSAGALGRLIRDHLGISHPRPLLVRIHEACAGNAFLALEMSRMLAGREAPAPGAPFPVPPETGALVRAHLATLSPAARRALLLVAMSPAPSPESVPRLLGTGGAEAVDEAFQLGFLVVDGGRLRAQHPLYAAIAYADAPPGELRRLRRKLADQADDPVERAVHLSAIAEPGDDRAVAALATAADLATARGAPGVAASLLERAAEVTGSPSRRPALLLDAADAAGAAGDPDRAASSLHLVLDLAPAGRLRARALLALGELAYVQQPTQAHPLLIAALAHTDGDPLLEAMVHSHIAAMADMDPPAANLSTERAADILQRPDLSPDPDHLACALLDRAFHCLLRGEPPDPADVERGLALRTGTGTSFVARRAQEVAERTLFHLGRLAEARALDEAEYRRLTDAGQVGLLPPLVQALSVLTQLSGDWAAAHRYAQECLDLVEQGELAWRDRAMLAIGRVQAWEGDLDGARSIAVPALVAQEAAGDRWEATIFCALLGFVELSVPDAPRALHYLTAAMRHADAIKVVLPTQFRFLGDLVEAAVLAGDLGLAEEVLVRRLEQPATRLALPWTVAMARRGRGLLTAAQGQLDAGISCLDTAIGTFDSELPMPFELARTRYLRGNLQRHAGHRRAARADLLAAQADFESLGARAWAARAAQELGRIGGRVATGTALTAAERYVAELAATGRSNREIAAELLVSTRTVESQLSSVYRKLQVRSRGQLATALAQLPADPANRA